MSAAAVHFRTRSRKPRAFSMIEVVIALGLVSFALIAVIGLFSAGLRTNRESSDQIEASNVASLITAALRAMPTNPPGGFAIPRLNQGTTTNTVQIGADGTTASPNLVYNLYYVVGTNSETGSKLANIYLLLWWPKAAKMPTNNPSSYYEIVGQVALP